MCNFFIQSKQFGKPCLSPDFGGSESVNDPQMSTGVSSNFITYK